MTTATAKTKSPAEFDAEVQKAREVLDAVHADMARRDQELPRLRARLHRLVEDKPAEFANGEPKAKSEAASVSEEIAALELRDYDAARADAIQLLRRAEAAREHDRKANPGRWLDAIEGEARGCTKSMAEHAAALQDLIKQYGSLQQESVALVSGTSSPAHARIQVHSHDFAPLTKLLFTVAEGVAPPLPKDRA